MHARVLHLFKQIFDQVNGAQRAGSRNRRIYIRQIWEWSQLKYRLRFLEVDFINGSLKIKLIGTKEQCTSILHRRQD